MKKIYEFELKKKDIVDEVEVTTNDKGEEIRITKKVEKFVPHQFFIRKPSRSLFDDAEIFYAKTLSLLIQQGVISLNQLEKRFIDDGGVFSKQEITEYENLYKSALEKQTRLNELNKIKEEDRTDEQKEEAKKTGEDLVEIFKQIQKFNNSKNSLYSNTAEMLARNKLVLFWTLMLSYRIENSKEAPVFGEGTYEDRLKKYDEIEEKEDTFQYEMIEKLLQITSLWHFGKAKSKEDFEALLLFADNQDILNLVNPAPENKETKT